MADPATIAITVVSVAHNSAFVLPTMLASVPEGVPVIVVDNGSRDSDRIASIAQHHDARLIRNDGNVVFGQACNQTAAQVDTPLILFLNPDAELVHATVDRLAEASCRCPDASAFNPAIEHPNGAQFFKTSSPISPSRSKLPRGWPSDDRQVPVLSGSALLVRKRDFDAVGGFDPEIFLYCEDDDLSLRLEAGCGPLMFIRNARVIHRLGGSSGTGLETLRLKGRSFGHSLVYASLKHKKPMAFERALIRAAGMAFSLSSITSKTHRIWAFSHLQGVLSARRFNPPAGARLRKWILRSRSEEGPTIGRREGVGRPAEPQPSGQGSSLALR